jgi:purine catabolism regulator
VPAATLSLGDVLALPVVQRARPELVAGTPADLERAVRWVHTSEIYDISPLLKGGEVLLTTGLGLVGLAADALRRYVASLTGTGVAALFLELGRTFAVAPPALLDAARHEGLPLVALHGVVPFIEITEAVHPLLIGGEVDKLRAGAELADRLVAGMVNGDGLPGMVARIAEIVGSPVSLVSVGGEVIAGTTLTGSDDAAEVLAMPVSAGGTQWGTLLLSSTLSPSQRSIVERSSGLLALELQRAHPRLPSRDQAGGDLLLDIVGGRFASPSEVARRAAGVGLVVGAGQRAVALSVLVSGGGRPPLTAVTAARTATRRVFGTGLIAATDEVVIVATALRARELRARLDEFASVVRTELGPGSDRRFVVSAGPFVDDVAELGQSVAAAGETAVLARRLTPSAHTVLADDFALYQLIAGLVEDAALERFVQDQIGTLIEFDARTGSELVRTLDTYLSCSLSKSSAAAALGVRRQTLYSRLDRISTLLGGVDLEHRERRTAIDLALVGWRLRTSAATR